jgi:hypothetical protein
MLPVVTQTKARGWLGGTLAIDLASAPARLLPRLDRVRTSLTLRRRCFGSDEATEVPFWFEEAGWLHVPKGWLLTAGKAWLSELDVEDGRSAGTPLPAGTAVTVGLGIAPFPAGQPGFVADIVAGSRANRHGGLALAPTRAGKTLCAIEAACRLGGSTLVLVDRSPLLRQWQEAIREFVRDGAGKPLPCGIVREGRFEVGQPFAVGMLQTFARRRLSAEARRAFRTVIVDECQTSPCESVWSALRRLEARYVLGLTATPDRGDGLTEAIGWVIGPLVAKLERRLDADVHYLHVPWRSRGKVPIRNGCVNSVAVEKKLLADPARVAVIAAEAIRARAAGRRVLVLAGLREHVTRLAQEIEAQGYAPGVLMAGCEDYDAAMARDICVATLGFVEKGTDFKPPHTALFLAAPRSNVAQAVGRALQPQATCRTIIRDVVDEAPPLLGQAMRRSRYYGEKGFRMRNRICREVSSD